MLKKTLDVGVFSLDLLYVVGKNIIVQVYRGNGIKLKGLFPVQVPDQISEFILFVGLLIKFASVNIMLVLKISIRTCNSYSEPLTMRRK